MFVGSYQRYFPAPIKRAFASLSYLDCMAACQSTIGYWQDLVVVGIWSEEAHPGSLTSLSRFRSPVLPSFSLPPFRVRQCSFFSASHLSSSSLSPSPLLSILHGQWPMDKLKCEICFRSMLSMLLLMYASLITWQRAETLPSSLLPLPPPPEKPHLDLACPLSQFSNHLVTLVAHARRL